MKSRLFSTVVLAALLALTALAAETVPARAHAPLVPNDLPIRGFFVHRLFSPSFDEFLDFVKTDLPREGVNCLVFQINYYYQFKSRPEMVAQPAYSRDQIKQLVAACREHGIKLVPLVNCLGHQSWAKETYQLLTAHPEFDETPGLFPNNEGLYCRSYCPNHPDVHKVLFDVLGEIADAFETKDLHVGMDEVFTLATDTCPRCHGADPAELYAQEVRTLHDFLQTKGIRTWMWGDRLIDGRTTGLGKWRASLNNTSRAVDLIPKDVLICDWHYDDSPPTATYFAMKGFDVVSCSSRNPVAACRQIDQMVEARAANANNAIGPHLRGIMATVWGDCSKVVQSYRTAKSTHAPADNSRVENFIQQYDYLRKVSAETIPVMYRKASDHP